MNLDLLKVTENAALAASKLVGRGDKIKADLEATLAMRDALNQLDFAGKIVLGEGRKDDAPGLFEGELVGKIWKGPDAELTDYYDIAVDPLDGTTPTAKGGYEAMSVIALGCSNCLFSAADYYMNKLAVGLQVAGKVDLSITDSISRTIKLISLATKKPPVHITVCVLDRPRHDKLVEELRLLGCRIRFIQDCDVSGALCTALLDSGIDVYMGIGGTPEGVIAAAALKCLKGSFQGMLCDKEGNIVDDTVYKMEDLVKGDVTFCATGVTDGSLLKGIRYTANKSITHSVLMDSASSATQWITTEHIA
jgi:fructose-1,6-bisphosphatase class II